MKIPVSRSIKIAYCLNLVALITVFCFVIWQHLHSPIMDLLRIAVPSGVLALLCYRLIMVVRKPTALDAVVPNRLIKTLRALAVFLMWVGVFAMVSLVFVKQITLIIFSGSTEPGLGMLPVLMFIGMAGILGIVGGVIFEVTRFVGHQAKPEQA